MECKYCNGKMYDSGLYPIVKCSVCGKIAIDYNEQFYKEIAEHRAKISNSGSNQSPTE